MARIDADRPITVSRCTCHLRRADVPKGRFMRCDRSGHCPFGGDALH